MNSQPSASKLQKALTAKKGTKNISPKADEFEKRPKSGGLRVNIHARAKPAPVKKQLVF